MNIQAKPWRWDIGDMYVHVASIYWKLELRWNKARSYLHMYIQQGFIMALPKLWWYPKSSWVSKLIHGIMTWMIWGSPILGIPILWMVAHFNFVWKYNQCIHIYIICIVPIHTLHYITLHYITLHTYIHYIQTNIHTYIHTYIRLHYIPLHCITCMHAFIDRYIHS